MAGIIKLKSYAFKMKFGGTCMVSNSNTGGVLSLDEALQV